MRVGSDLHSERGTWHPVAASMTVACGQVVRFTSKATVGFVSRHGDRLHAVSGVCPHEGCLLVLDQGGAQLNCRCHGAAFGLSGEACVPSCPDPLVRLEHLQVRERGASIEVLLPVDASPARFLSVTGEGRVDAPALPTTQSTTGERR
jgi:nitrite reductase/ring-hydroxylating ferredoxin subunit